MTTIPEKVGDLCHFDRLRNSCAFRSRQTKKSGTYVISTGSETDGLLFGLSPGPSCFETARKRASRFIDPRIAASYMVSTRLNSGVRRRTYPPF